ncbi:hypothetical protein PVAG01_01585 [Phlyctema vagabunda]|uniref:Large ribosomal subunit protein mL40 n=1 Tax=Phlyctema vagabunda TaxID=108571 RepID=A0ABR4PYX1_9HELO
MANTTPLFRLLTPLLQTFRGSNVPSFMNKPSLLSRGFSSTATLAKDDKRNKTDPRITLIRYHLQHPKTPRPLRLSRLRALRHWTIHRAWMLARRKKAEQKENELRRIYQSMHAACEELRLLDPPGTKDAGRLYRIAMEKKGVFRHGGVPIEYARHQVETPGHEPWNHSWTR